MLIERTRDDYGTLNLKVWLPQWATAIGEL